MPAVKESTDLTLNEHISDYVRADVEFIQGIKKGVRACCEGRVRPWNDIKKELRLK